VVVRDLADRRIRSASDLAHDGRQPAQARRRTGGVPTGDEAFDRAFRVEADVDMTAEAVSVINDRVRSRIMEDTPHGRVAIELRNHRLLYCVARLPIDERAGLLEIATRLRDAIPVR
jgi:hypothetical protein